MRYSNDVLRKSPWLKNTEISIEVDEQDMRAVRAYFPDGEPIGMLLASGKWAITKHSRKTRKAINQLKSDRALTISDLDDPVEQYLKYLRNQVVVDQAGRSKTPVKESSRSVATEINRLSSEIATDRPDLVSKFLGADRKESTDPQLKMQEAEEALPPSLSTRTVIKTVMSSKIPNLKGLMKDF
ncbi:hypothetical protein D3C85_1370280 [compost metagenome]